jgi:hypothetical protein
MSYISINFVLIWDMRRNNIDIKNFESSLRYHIVASKCSKFNIGTFTPLQIIKPVNKSLHLLFQLLPDFNHSSFFVKRFDFQAVPADKAGFSLWTSQQEILLQRWGCQLHVPNSTLRTSVTSFIVTIPFRDDPGIRCQIFTFTPPFSGLVFANT